MTTINQRLKSQQDTMPQTVANVIVTAMQQFHNSQPPIQSQTLPITPNPSPSDSPTHTTQIPMTNTTSTLTIPTLIPTILVNPILHHQEYQHKHHTCNHPHLIIHQQQHLYLSFQNKVPQRIPSLL